MKEGIITFYGYSVEEISYYKNNDYKNSSDYIDLSPQFLFNLIISKDTPYKYNTIMGVRIGYLNKNESPFTTEVILRGFFEIKGFESDKEHLHDLYSINSSAILFPYLRSILTDITSKSDHEPVILPTFNFHTMLDDLNFEDLILDSNEYKEYK